MLVDTIIGNVKTLTNVDNVEWIEVDWEELNKRILRKETDKGREIAIRLAGDAHLHFGDIVYQNEGVVIAIRTKLEPAYVITPKSMNEMGKVAFELGNRHTPSLISDTEIVVRFDETLESIFLEAGVTYEKKERRFEKPFKYKGHHHH
ncbi:urease accessory protein UreE [Alkalihalobacillus sp. BA299]|uniref:urease accessory protein UreE n=1 Tax=Alkalihalobacillus sp. BA299 TaxID=2815938 RepID=UPI001ADA5897|nr:urease accessory protein UreE [Alkalihalobacillus sp. BA299]